MTEDRLPLAELLQKAGEGDFLRAVAEAVLHSTRLHRLAAFARWRTRGTARRPAPAGGRKGGRGGGRSAL
jgi:hypothetical protein